VVPWYSREKGPLSRDSSRKTGAAGEKNLGISTRGKIPGLHQKNGKRITQGPPPHIWREPRQRKLKKKKNPNEERGNREKGLGGEREVTPTGIGGVGRRNASVPKLSKGCFLKREGERGWAQKGGPKVS